MINKTRSYLLIIVVVLIISCKKDDPKMFNPNETYVLENSDNKWYDGYDYYVEFPPNSLPYPEKIMVERVLEVYGELIPKYFIDSDAFLYFNSEIQELKIPATLTVDYGGLLKRPISFVYPFTYIKLMNHSDVKVYKIENKGTNRVNSVLDISNWQEIPHLSIDSTDNRITFELTDLTAIYVLAHEFE